MNCPSYTLHAENEAIIDKTQGKIHFTTSKPRTYAPGRLPFLGKPALERLWREAGDTEDLLGKIKAEEAT